MNMKLFSLFSLLAFVSPAIGYAYTEETLIEQHLDEVEKSKTIHVETAGTLSSLITEGELRLLDELKVSGTINISDVNFLKQTYAQTSTPINMDFSEALFPNGSFSMAVPGLSQIILPQGLSSIANDAFNNCSSLTYAALPDGVKSVGARAFKGCSILQEIDIPESVTIIYLAAFSDCLKLQRVKLPSGITNLENSLFNGCSSLSSIIIPENVHSIGTWTFNGCKSLKRIEIPPNIVSIGDKAFSECTQLEKVIFSSVEALCNITFSGTSSNPMSLGLPLYIGNDDKVVKDVIIPSNVTRINNDIFSNVEILEFVSEEVPEIGTDIVSEQSIIIVPAKAFDSYSTHPNLKKYAALDHIVTSRSLFEQCVVVKAMNGGSGIFNELGEERMKNVYHLTLSGSINGYDVMMIRNKMPNLMHLDMADVEIVGNPYEYYQGNHTEEHRLGANMFRDMKNLRTINLPAGVSYIEDYAFYGCSNLEEVVIPTGVVGIGAYALADCTSLHEIEIPCSVKKLGDYAFYRCSKMHKVGLSEGLLEISSNVFASDTRLCDVDIPSTVTSIGAYSFYQCSSLKQVNLPPRLTKILGSTFAQCTSLEKIVIPPMTEIINESAFSQTKLKDIYVYLANPKDITISLNTFDCWKTATLHIPSFGFSDYYLHPIWGQFSHFERFDEPYVSFYTKNTITLDQNTGVIDGAPDALLYEKGCLQVNDNQKQALSLVTLNHDGKDGSSLIAEQRGNIMVEKINVDINVRANSWHFLCFPFDIDLSSINYDGDYIWRQYDGARRSRKEGGWQNLAEGTTILQANRGYIFRGSNAGTLHLEASSPTITSENVSLGLTKNESADPADANWNFIGNPYTAYYVVDETTYASPFTVWTGSGYEAYRPGDDDYEFAPYQAFFVQSGGINEAINFNADNREGYEEMQAAQSQRHAARAQKKINPNRLLVNLQLGVQGEEEYLDKTRVVFNDACSLDYESDCDAAKFFSEERRAELYTIGADGTQYAINERPEEGGYVNLGFVANQKGKYSISAQRIDVPMLLVDDVMETTFDLRNGAYEFSSAKGTFNKRFYLKRYEGITTSIKELADQIGMTFCISDGTISFEGLDDATRVSLYNTAGQQIATQQGNGTFTAFSGTYIISVGKLTAKVLL